MSIDIKIEQWITRNPAQVDCQAHLSNAIGKMVERKIGAILVSKGKRLAGIFTERDLLKLFISGGAELLDQPIAKFMTPDPISAQIDEDYNLVYMKMKTHGIRHIPVLQGDEIVGIVSIRDLIHFYQNKLESDFVQANRELEELRKLVNLSSDRKLEALYEQIHKYKELSLTDHLTGLYNKRYFQARLTEEFNRAIRHDIKLSLIFCDIDHFKQINDHYGHACGDEVLKKIAKILYGEMDDLHVISRLRKSDIVARYGGEEFVVILPETPLEGAIVAAEKMRKAVADTTFKLSGEPVKVTVSFGVADFTSRTKKSADLIRNADEALYSAKEGGRNRVEAFIN